LGEQPGMSTLIVILVAVACRMGFAATTGLGIDESYMVASSHSFAASYFDHPLASWWLELGSRAVFGGDAPWVVRLPFVALSGISSLLLWRLTVRLYGRQAGFWAVVAYSISPVFSLAFGCWVLPDGPLDAALLGFAYALVRALGVDGAPRALGVDGAPRALGVDGAPPAPRWWALVGLCAGLAMLSKYNAALVMIGVLGLAPDPRFRAALRGPAPWAALLLALALFSPVLWWNITHHFASFAYQGGRAAAVRLRPAAPLTIWAGEALFILPWLWLPMIGLLIAAFRAGPVARRGWLLACLSVVPIMLFALIGLWSGTRILYHWAAPGYLMLFPLLGAWAARLAPRLRDLVAALSAFLLVTAAALIAAELQFGFIAHLDAIFPPGKSPLLQAVDWRSLRGEIPAGVQAIAALRWYDAGKIGYALSGDGHAIAVFGPEPHEFAQTTPAAALLGRNVLIIAMPGDADAIERRYAPDFTHISPGPVLTVIHNGALLLAIPTLIGTDMTKVPQN
jgi:4-amino-4-deoxy-L-arabinose transferase-like glycosyltransferase